MSGRLRLVPTKMRQLVAKQLGTNFRQVTEIVETATPTPGPKEVLVRTRYVGINASDINFTAGRYFANVKPPFPVGFEGLGEVVTAGSDTKLKAGQTVMYSKYGAFADYLLVEEAVAIPLPVCDPNFLTLMVSGLTASIALEKEGDLKPGKNVLVTAAAGGTGQFAVQLAKLEGCHVIGTCSSDEKGDFLKSLGCDRVVNYNKEQLNDVLTKEYPKGIDVVYESIGNEMFDTALKNLAVFGRLIVIGLISNYQGGAQQDFDPKIKDSSKVSVALSILSKSASVRGFFLPNYREDYPRHTAKLSKLYQEGKLKIVTDNGKSAATGPFLGLEKVADAIDYMYTKKNLGKIVVEINKGDKSAL